MINNNDSQKVHKEPWRAIQSTWRCRGHLCSGKSLVVLWEQEKRTHFCYYSAVDMERLSVSLWAMLLIRPLLLQQSENLTGVWRAGPGCWQGSDLATVVCSRWPHTWNGAVLRVWLLGWICVMRWVWSGCCRMKALVDFLCVSKGLGQSRWAENISAVDKSRPEAWMRGDLRLADYCTWFSCCPAEQRCCWPQCPKCPSQLAQMLFPSISLTATTVANPAHCMAQLCKMSCQST